MTPLHVKRLPYRLDPDNSRTITRFFWPGPERAQRIVTRVMALPKTEVKAFLQTTLQEFVHRHVDLEELLLAQFEKLVDRINANIKATASQKLLLGAYFTMEYAFESAALFNPSMVPRLADTDTPPGATPFLMSLRAVGEGHVSSIVFRRGMILASGVVYVEPVGPLTRCLETSQHWNPDKVVFRRKLEEMGCHMPAVDAVLAHVTETFTDHQLNQAFDKARAGATHSQEFDRIADDMRWLAHSSYEIRHDDLDKDMAQIVLFPTSDAESMGMEDMRLVCFQEDDGTLYYYGTYTAYNGQQILPQLIKVGGQGRSHVVTLMGDCARNKGMALFPRRIDGQYAMVSRIDGENLFLMRSDQVDIWEQAELIQQPQYPWEFVQIGNCGSPIETEAGWLLLTHGVGPMRKYCMAATLLDLKDPTKIVGQLREPLMTPSSDERSGYVPNVVYSCGGMVHDSTLIIPYGISDVATGFATVSMDALLEHLTA